MMDFQRFALLFVCCLYSTWGTVHAQSVHFGVLNGGSVFRRLNRVGRPVSIVYAPRSSVTNGHRPSSTIVYGLNSGTGSGHVIGARLSSGTSNRPVMTGNSGNEARLSDGPSNRQSLIGSYRNGAALADGLSNRQSLTGSYRNGAALSDGLSNRQSLTGSYGNGARLSDGPSYRPLSAGSYGNGARLSSDSSQRPVFPGYHGNGARLSGAPSNGPVLTGSYGNEARLSDGPSNRPELTGIYRNGARLSGGPSDMPDLTGSYRNGARLSGAPSNGPVLTGSYGNEARLSDGPSNRPELTGSYRNGARLSGGPSNAPLLTGSYRNGPVMPSSNGNGARLSGGPSNGPVWNGSYMNGARLPGASGYNPGLAVGNGFGPSSVGSYERGSAFAPGSNRAGEGKPSGYEMSSSYQGGVAGSRSNVRREGGFPQRINEEENRPCSYRSLIERSCPLDRNSETTRLYLDRYVEKNPTQCIQDQSKCNTYKLPRNYVAHHLNGRQINIDGRLDEEAWREVPWTKNFTDIRSTVYPVPYLDTRVKIRWDDTHLYIGAYLQERDLWGTKTKPDDKVWLDNGFEMLMDVDYSMRNYKQIGINVLGTVMDQLWYKSPHDGGESWLDWSADANSAVYAEGTVNDASDRDESWTVEMALSFKALAARSNKMSRITPDDGETWFMNFGRSEQSLIVTDKDTYVKDESVPTSWRSWQPCGAINLHLQDRWGLVQFRKTTNEPFYFRDWHVFRAAFDVMDAEKKQKTLNAHYTDNLAELDMPPYLMTGVCVDIPKIKVTRNGQEDFLATVTSKLYKNLTMQIRPDRYVTRAITDCKVKK